MKIEENAKELEEMASKQTTVDLSLLPNLLYRKELANDKHGTHPQYVLKAILEIHHRRKEHYEGDNEDRHGRDDESDDEGCDKGDNKGDDEGNNECGDEEMPPAVASITPPAKSKTSLTPPAPAACSPVPQTPTKQRREARRPPTSLYNAPAPKTDHYSAPGPTGNFSDSSMSYSAPPPRGTKKGFKNTPSNNPYNAPALT